MTSRSLIPVEVEVLERMAYKSGQSIVLGPDRAYLTLGLTTFVAEIEPIEAAS